MKYIILSELYGSWWILWGTHIVFGMVCDFLLYQKVVHETFCCVLMNMWIALACEVLFVRLIETSLS
jgi:hypothetical protein